MTAAFDIATPARAFAFRLAFHERSGIRPPMAKAPTSPTEPFKRALTAAVRSLGEAPELEVVYSGEGPKMAGGRLILPHPQRDMPAADVARIRGLADRAALKLA